VCVCPPTSRKFRQAEKGSSKDEEKHFSVDTWGGNCGIFIIIFTSLQRLKLVLILHLTSHEAIPANYPTCAEDGFSGSVAGRGASK
jgi:hypothetical protein